MQKGNIPGLSLVIIQEGQEPLIKNYGEASPEQDLPVTGSTIFELGSTSKAFTALAVMHLERQGKLDLSKYVDDYLPWFSTQHKGVATRITLRQLLHHTSGIPWKTIAKIPATSADDALEQTVRTLVGQELFELPGREYQYATINYDVLALLVQQVSGQPFERYLQEAIIAPLGLSNTSIGAVTDSSLLATGHKGGFLRAQSFEAPIYKGNNAAGYVTSNALDIAAWVQFQLGLSEQHDLYQSALRTHERDESVPLHFMESYAAGWQVVLDGTGEIYHDGLNPNYSSYIALKPEAKFGIAILTNANSNYTPVLGDRVMKILTGYQLEELYEPGDGGDQAFSAAALALIIYMLVVIGYVLYIVSTIIKGNRLYEAPGTKKVAKFALSLAFATPFLAGLYLVPRALAGFTWEALLVWTPYSAEAVIYLLLGAIALSYMAYALTLFFPEQDKIKKKAPAILLMTMLSGLANVVVIVIVTSAIDSDVELRYMLFYYSLVIGIYLAGRRFVQVNLIRITRGLVYDLRVKLVNKIFSTSYERFERIDRGKVYTALNDDVNTIGESTNLFVSLVTSIITALGAFVYLGALAFWATLITIGLILIITAVYYVVGQRANKYFEDARDSRNVFMRLLNGMIDGYKEISLHRSKKIAYKQDIEASAMEFREKRSVADIKFTNAFLVGESLLVVLLGAVSIGMTVVFTSIQSQTIMSFVIVLLYLIGPVNAILNSIPGLLNLKIAWNRVRSFTDAIPVNLDIEEIPEVQIANTYRLETKDLVYRYDSAESNGFQIGPINLEIESGEILFIIGGNGSGKTTLAKILTGLYRPSSGQVEINGIPQDNYQLSERYSTVFNPPYLFEKLYDTDLEGKDEAIAEYLKLLDLDKKVQVVGDRYSTINLSSGQKKRLSLMQCFLEDYPIYLFDEWAADQDPEYRKFFYRTLLPQMRAAGKIVIAITHDDHYFDVADKIIKLDRGQIDYIKHPEDSLVKEVY